MSRYQQLLKGQRTRRRMLKVGRVNRLLLRMKKRGATWADFRFNFVPANIRCRKNLLHGYTAGDAKTGIKRYQKQPLQPWQLAQMGYDG